jgi:hypothetical protein
LYCIVSQARWQFSSYCCKNLTSNETRLINANHQIKKTDKEQPFRLVSYYWNIRMYKSIVVHMEQAWSNVATHLQGDTLLVQSLSCGDVLGQETFQITL